ncbi:MAG: nicotinate-nicotinamide nucleotide adenylyltransferase [Bacteroidales bacterium]|jgi:nicotinate-nucleotide adenylyltransferase|nr:nicotinate-nicotinamide nucleotide adenylyltransferase [Bacteroidales bacterium]
MKRTALYFGSFNPLHYGHLGVAEYVILNCDIDRFEMVLSPHNPFKDKQMLQDPQERLKSLRKAIRAFNKQLKPKIEANPEVRCKGVIVNDIEFHLKEPLYTFNTMKELQKRNPGTEYIIVVGADSFKIMPKWYLGEDILREFKVIVYPRKGYRVKTQCRKYKALYLEDAPLNDISSTQIRNGEL